MQIVFSLDFKGPFVPLSDLHNSFTETGAKTMRTLLSNKCCYQQERFILYEFPLILHEVCLCGSTPKEEEKKQESEREKTEKSVRMW